MGPWLPVFFVVLFYLIALETTQAAFGASVVTHVVYISPNGSDRNNGTEVAPVFSFRKAVSMVAVGGTINAFSGTYNISVDDNNNVAVHHHAFTLQAHVPGGYAVGNEVIIEGSKPGNVVFDIKNSTIHFKLLYFRALNDTTVILAERSNITLESCSFDTCSNLVLIFSTSNISFYDTLFAYHYGSDTFISIDIGPPIYDNTESIIFSHCTFRNNTQGNLIDIDSASPTTDVTFDSCIFEDNTDIAYAMVAITTSFYNLDYTDTMSVVFVNSRFQANRLHAGKPVLYIHTQLSVVTIADCAFIDNGYSPYVSGSPLLLYGLSAIYYIRNCVFANNSAIKGGAVCEADDGYDWSVFYENCWFTENRAQTAGAGYFAAPYISLNNCTFVRNSAKLIAPLRGGGGAVLFKSTTAVTNCTFLENSANSSGGAIEAFAPLNITNSVFANNTAFGKGGAVAIMAYTKTPVEQWLITHSVFSENSAGLSGGALSVAPNCGVMITSTVFNHNAVLDGGGSAVFVDSFASVNCYQCLFLGNREPASIASISLALLGYASDFGLFHSGMCTDGSSANGVDTQFSLKNDIMCQGYAVVRTNMLLPLGHIDSKCNVTVAAFVLSPGNSIQGVSCTHPLHNVSTLYALTTQQAVFLNLTDSGEYLRGSFGAVAGLQLEPRFDSAVDQSGASASMAKFGASENAVTLFGTGGQGSPLHVMLAWNDKPTLLSPSYDMTATVFINSTGAARECNGHGMACTADDNSGVIVFSYSLEYAVEGPSAYVPNCRGSMSTRSTLLTGKTRNVDIEVRDQWNRPHSLNGATVDQQLQLVIEGANPTRVHISKMSRTGLGRYEYDYQPSNAGVDTFYLQDGMPGTQHELFRMQVVWVWWLVISSCGFVLLCGLIVVAAIAARRLRRAYTRRNILQDYQPLNFEAFTIKDVSFPRDLEIAYSDINILQDHVTSGGQGDISVGLWKSIKVVVKRYSIVSEEELQSFLKEANLLKSLRHPNIVQLLGICREPLAIVMEFVARGSLFSLLHSRQTAPRVTLSVAIAMASDIARGMMFLHSRQILHRDLKSSNMLVTEAWAVKIADFGLSRQASSTMTMAVGTPRWTAPEVFSGQHYTDKADVYSFGVILWEMIEKRIPWEELKSETLVTEMVLQGHRPTFSNSTGWPAELKSLVTDCWEQDPTYRPSFEEILDVLEELRLGYGAV